MNENNTVTVADAINSLVPTAKFCVTQNDKDQIDWQDDSVTQPTKKEIDAEIFRLQAVYDAKEYARNRKAEYPTIPDQLDEIYHNGIDSWKAVIKVTKDKYPKS